MMNLEGDGIILICYWKMIFCKYSKKPTDYKKYKLKKMSWYMAIQMKKIHNMLF